MDIIRKYRDVALSDKEVRNLVKERAKVVLYPEVSNYDTLDELLYPYEACFILYESKPNYGHWCCIFKQQNDLIEFFDPYGVYPDDELLLIPNDFRKESKQDKKYILGLMYYSPYRLSYNEHQFQKKRKDIKTCGRWCSLRIILRDWPLEKFARIFQNTESDDLVTFLTL